MVKNNKKLGFTLMEALVVLLILSIFLAASAKVFTKKRKSDFVVHQHGQFECWKEGSNHKSEYIIEGIKSGIETSGAKCIFTPTLEAALYHIYTVQSDGYKIKTIYNINQDIEITLNPDNISFSQMNGETYSDFKNGTDMGGNYNNFKSVITFLYGNKTNLLNKTPAVLIVW